MQTQSEVFARYKEFVRHQPQVKLCRVHPEIKRCISLDETRKATVDNGGTFTAGYEPCPRCQEEKAEALSRQRLERQGVEPILLSCSLDNWNPRNADEQGFLEEVRQFAVEIRLGFLCLLGDIGTGKSHLAVGVLRHFHSGIFVKQNELLRRLRETYRERNAKDPVDQCRDVGLLVLDEVGFSGGGRDELPMLHAILDHRYGTRKPTVITANLNWNQLKSTLGPRLADRLRESCFRVITLAGESHRAGGHERYFATK